MDPRRRARIILILGILLALGAGAGTYVYVSGAASAPPPELPTAEVVVAAKDIPARTELTATDVKVVKVNLDAAPPSAIKDPKEVIGQILIQPLAVNEPVLPSKFAPRERAFTVFPPGEQIQAGSPAYRIMTITVSDQNAVGGVLVAGDNVDVMFVFKFNPEQYFEGVAPAGGATGGAAATPNPVLLKIMSDTVAKIIIGPMQILARTGAVYTIRVDATLAERIAYIQASGGTLQFLLRAPGDDRAAGTTGATFKNIYDTFKIPLPQRIPPPQ